MKHNFKIMALFVGLSMLAVGCQKENYVEQSISDVEQQHYAKVRYTIDGVTMTATFNDEM